MAKDFRNAPDSEVIDPDRCGHTITVGSVAFDCGVDGEHTAHEVTRPGMARRTQLGFGDVQAADMFISWVDDRPNATVGDVRALIRQNEESKP